MSAPQTGAPLTLAQVARIPQADPASTVMRLWFWAQWGSFPNVAASYDPRVIQIAGPQGFFQVFVIQRSTLLQFHPRVTAVTIRGPTAFVAVVGEAAGVKPYYTSFDLRRVSNVWLITHDTLLEGTLPSAIAGLLDPNPVRTVPPAQYLRQGEAVMTRIRAYAAGIAQKAALLPLQTIST